MASHFYNDYAKTTTCSSAVKKFVKKHSSGDAVMTLFLWMYSNGLYGTGDINEGVYQFKKRVVTVKPKNGKLHIAFRN